MTVALALRDCKVKSIVDWTHEVDDDGERPRNPIRRGIITKVVGDNSPEGSVKEIHVLFNRGEEPVVIKGAELSRVPGISVKQANEAWRRVMGEPKIVGSERTIKHQERRRRVDALGLTPRNDRGLVSPSIEREAELDAMGFNEGDDVAVDGAGEAPEADEK